MSQANTAITIVSGLPRSGTSMMMQMLAAGGLPILAGDIRPADEDNPHGYFEFEPVKQTRRNSDWVPQAQGKAVKVIYKLLEDLPAEYLYRVVFMRRDLAEVVASQQQMLYRREKPGADLPPEEMVRVFEAELDRTLAWLPQQSNFEVLCVDYSQAVQDSVTVAGQVSQFLGLSLDITAMSASVRPNLHRQSRA